MAYDNTLILDHIEQTHNTEFLSEREDIKKINQHLVEKNAVH